MNEQIVHVVAAEGEEGLAEELARPLREAGYAVTHNGTVAIGDSFIAEALKALAAYQPVVLCATPRAVGSAWTHQIVNASRVSGPPRVFVVLMDKNSYVDQLAINTRVARYCDNREQAVQELITSLARSFPAQAESSDAPRPHDAPESRAVFLDEPTGHVVFDVEAVQVFRRDLRPEVARRYPSSLSPWKFLDQAGLWVGESLSRAGALLFGEQSVLTTLTSMVKCVEYFGVDRSAERDALTFDGSIIHQIDSARDFVAKRVRRGETPSETVTQSVDTYDLPMVAVREILANAFVHRNYDTSEECVHVRLFADRLEVSSPGGWVGRDLLADAEHDLADLEGHSIKRNFRLAHVLSWAKFVEGEGSGIPTAIADCRKSQNDHPTVTQAQGFVTVTIRRRARDVVVYGQTGGIALGVIQGSAVYIQGGQQQTVWPPQTQSDASSTQEFLIHYRRHVVEQHGKLEPPDFDRRRRMPLADNYVSPSITMADGNPEHTIDIWRFCEEIDHVVLLGDPGSGKTTACNVIMHKYAGDSQSRIPFLVTLRTLAAQDPPERSIVGHIEHTLETFYQCPAPPGAIEQFMLTGNALVIFDGLDELLDSARRGDVSQRIELFCAEYPLARVLVTSRRVGYDQARLDVRQFRSYSLGGFEDSQVSEFAHKWFAQESITSANEAAVFLDESASVHDLRANPLLLSLMCILYRGEGSLPRNRAEMYEQCATLLFRRWDARRRIHLELRAGHLIEPTLRHLAWWLFTREDTYSAVSEPELVREVAAYLYERGFESPTEAREAAAEFVSFCRGRMWVFTDTGTNAAGENLYSFTHRTFLEYFAAAQLAAQSKSPEALARTLAPKVTNQKWETVGVLSVHITDRMTYRGAERAITALLDDRRYRRIEKRARILEFARECSDSVDLSPSIMRRIAK